MNKEQLLDMVNSTITTNGKRQITGKALNLALAEIINSMDAQATDLTASIDTAVSEVKTELTDSLTTVKTELTDTMATKAEVETIKTELSTAIEEAKEVLVIDLDKEYTQSEVKELYETLSDDTKRGEKVVKVKITVADMVMFSETEVGLPIMDDGGEGTYIINIRCVNQMAVAFALFGNGIDVSSFLNNKSAGELYTDVKLHSYGYIYSIRTDNTMWGIRGVVTSGDGTQFLSDDGTYKTALTESDVYIFSPADHTQLTEAEYNELKAAIEGGKTISTTAGTFVYWECLSGGTIVLCSGHWHNPTVGNLLLGANYVINGDTYAVTITPTYGALQSSLTSETTARETADTNLQTQIDAISESINNLSVDLFIIPTDGTLPETGEANKIYLISSDTTGDTNVFTEYVYANSSWEKIGEYRTDVSIENATQEAAGLMSAEDKTKLDSLSADSDAYIFAPADSTQLTEEEFTALKAAVDGNKVILFDLGDILSPASYGYGDGGTLVLEVVMEVSELICRINPTDYSVTQDIIRHATTDLVTTTSNGLMSAEDKTKLDAITASNTSIVTQAEYDALVAASATSEDTIYYIRG